MVKPGKTLYAGKCNGAWYIKQAKSPEQFTRLVIIEERDKNNYRVPHGARWMYTPDFYWDESQKVWRNTEDGSVYGPKLPPGAR